MTNNLKDDNELLSNCCSAKAYGEIDEADSTGRCSDCGDGCLFTTKETQSNPLEEVLKFIPKTTPGVECYDLNHKFMKCDLCGNSPRAKAEQAILALINQKEKEARIEELKNLMAQHSRTYEQRVTDSSGAVYVEDSHGYISKYETQERIEQLKEELKGGKD